MATKIESALANLQDEVDGFLSVNLIDAKSGMSMGYVGGADAEVDAVVSSKFYSAIDFGIKTLKLEDKVDDNLLSLGKTYHIVRFVEDSEDIFVHLALDRKRANLAMARHSLRCFVNDLEGQV